MTAVCVFVAKMPGRRFALPCVIRALFQAAEWESPLNRWGAGKFFQHDPDRTEQGLYYALYSEDDPENPLHLSGAEQFAGYFETAQNPAEEQRLVDAFMINM